MRKHLLIWLREGQMLVEGHTAGSVLGRGSRGCSQPQGDVLDQSLKAVPAGGEFVIPAHPPSGHLGM